jgi:hypothetical protein
VDAFINLIRMRLLCVCVCGVPAWAQGDFYLFNAGLLHEVPIVPEEGDPRIVLATFIGYSEHDPEIYVWS